MKIASLALLPLLALTACDSQPAYEWSGSGDDAAPTAPPLENARLQLELSSEINLEAAGIVLYGPDSGIMGVRYAGYGPVSCEFDVVAGEVLDDYDYDGGDETVDDFGGYGGVHTAVITTQGGVVLHTPFTPAANAEQEDDQMYVGGAPTFKVEGVVEARLGLDEVVALRHVDGGCAVHWLDSDQQTSVPDGLCARGFDVDPATGTAWASSEDDGLYRITPQGAEFIADAGKRLVWDESTRTLYVAGAQRGVVEARDDSGALLWSTPVNGYLRDMVPLAGHQAVAVLNHEATIELLDVHTGEIVGRQILPGTVRELAASPSGDTLLMARSGVTSVFSVSAID